MVIGPELDRTLGWHAAERARWASFLDGRDRRFLTADKTMSAEENKVKVF
jgi:hypothetical protein